MAGSSQTPLIDKRAAADIVSALRNGGVPSDGLGFALAQIFARYCEIVIERINLAPDKNFLAYLDLLGNTLLPPEAGPRAAYVLACCGRYPRSRRTRGHAGRRTALAGRTVARTLRNRPGTRGRSGSTRQSHGARFAHRPGA